MSDEEQMIAELMLKGLTYEEIRDKAFYLMHLNASQARTIDFLQANSLGHARVSTALIVFLDAAAGEGLVLNGVDAADLYIQLFPKEYEKQSAIPKEKP